MDKISELRTGCTEIGDSQSGLSRPLTFKGSEITELVEFVICTYGLKGFLSPLAPIT